MQPAKSAAKPAAPQALPSFTQVNTKTGRIIHNGKSYRVILHYDAGTKELNTPEQLKRIKKIIDLSRIGQNEKLSEITIEDGKVFRTKEPIEKKLKKVAGVDVPKTLEKIKTIFDKVVTNAGVLGPKPKDEESGSESEAGSAPKPAPLKAAAKGAAHNKAEAKPAPAKPKAPAKVELETDDEAEGVDGEDSSQISEQEEAVESDGASLTDNSESDEEDYKDVDAAAAKAAAKPEAKPAAKPKAPAAKSQAKPKAPAGKGAAKPAAESGSEVDESERSEVSEAAESDDEVKIGEGTTVEFVPADLLNEDEIPKDVIDQVIASTKVPAKEIKGYIPNHDHHTIFRAYGISYLVALFHQNDFKEFEDAAGAEINKLPKPEQDKILQEYGRFITDLNDLRTNSLVEFLNFLEREQNDKLLCHLLRSLARKQVDEADQSEFTNQDAQELRKIFNFGIISFPARAPIGDVKFDKSLWIYKTNDTQEFAALLRVQDDEDESLI